MPGFGLGHLIQYIVDKVSFIRHGLDHVFGWILPTLNAHVSEHGAAVVTKIHVSLVNSWPNRLTGLLMVLFAARRVIKGTMDDIQLVLCKQIYAHDVKSGHEDRTYPWFFTPLLNWQATFNDVKAMTTSSSAIEYNAAALWGLSFVLIVTVGLSIGGWYILLYVA